MKGAAQNLSFALQVQIPPAWSNTIKSLLVDENLFDMAIANRMGTVEKWKSFDKLVDMGYNVLFWQNASHHFWAETFCGRFGLGIFRTELKKKNAS